MLGWWWLVRGLGFALAVRGLVGVGGFLACCGVHEAREVAGLGALEAGTWCIGEDTATGGVDEFVEGVVGREVVRGCLADGGEARVEAFVYTMGTIVGRAGEVGAVGVGRGVGGLA